LSFGMILTTMVVSSHRADRGPVRMRCITTVDVSRAMPWRNPWNQAQCHGVAACGGNRSCASPEQ
jgi:hypothetical protein